MRETQEGCPALFKSVNLRALKSSQIYPAGRKNFFDTQKGTAGYRCSFYICASKTVSRVLYLTVIYLDAPLPVRSSHPGSGRASLGAQSPCSHTGVAPDRVYSDGYFDAPSGELLPRLSTLTAKAQPQRRYISVALFLKSPSAGVTRYPCPVEPGLSSQKGLSPPLRDCLFSSQGSF